MQKELYWLETHKTHLVPFLFLVYCDFDAKSLCQFTQGTKDAFDWTIHKGATSSAPETGPSTDVSLRGQRYKATPVNELSLKPCLIVTNLVSINKSPC